MQRNTPSDSRRTFLCKSLTIAGGLLLPTSSCSASRSSVETPNREKLVKYEYDTNVKYDPKVQYDVVIYGGTSAAVTAAIQTRRMGKSVVIVCPETHIGGLTTSGLGWTDSKDGNAIGGLAREFYHRVWQYYTNEAAWTHQSRKSYLEQRVRAQPGPAIDEQKQVMWTFEPSAAEQVMIQWLAEEKVPIFRDEWLDRKNGVEKKGVEITAIKMLSGKRFQARMFIDAGYEGDLMAAAGVTYRIGRDSASEFDEPLNGVRFPIKGIDRYHVDDGYPGVSPYKIPGKPDSGLIPGVESEWKDASTLGKADPGRLQSFNYRLCLTQEPVNRVPFPKPDGYDEKQYELLFRLFAAGETAGFTTSEMPNRKTDSNSKGSFSGDYVGGNYSDKGDWNYSESSYEQRKKVIAAHQRYQKGLLWTLQNHERTPSDLRERMATWGLSRDEFADNGHWPYQLYIREARRMQGVSMVTQHHVQLKPGYEVKDSIGLGFYSMDSHVVRRVVVDGKIKDEGAFYVYWDKPYPLPYGCIVPKKNEATNLLVPITISATHVAFGSIRMEPTYMILGQAAATAAVLALDARTPVQNIEYSNLAKRLSADGQVLFMGS